MAERKKKSLEEQFAELEQVIESLEQDEITLEEAFAFYTKGMKLLKDCNAQIDQVEKKVLKIEADGTFSPL